MCSNRRLRRTFTRCTLVRSTHDRSRRLATSCPVARGARLRRGVYRGGDQHRQRDSRFPLARGSLVQVSAGDVPGLPGQARGASGILASEVPVPRRLRRGKAQCRSSRAGTVGAGRIALGGDHPEHRRAAPDGGKPPPKRAGAARHESGHPMPRLPGAIRSGTAGEGVLGDRRGA